MRIVQLNPFYYPYRGGIEHRIHNLSRRLAKDHEVFIVTGRLPDTAEEQEMDGYTIVRLDSTLIGPYNPPYISSRGVWKTLATLDPDVVDFHYRWAPSYTRAMRRFDGRKVFTFHNTFGEGEGAVRVMSLINDLSQSRFLRGFDRIVCVSEFVRRDLEGRGFPNRLLETVPNGVELPDDVPRDELDFLLFLGRLVPTKGLGYLLGAMRDLRSRGIRERLIIAGGGPEEARLRRNVKRMGLEDTVTITGRVTEEEKQRLLGTCKLFVLPSTFESYGIAAAEAMAYGKAVVATRVGGLPEVIADAGVLVPPKDPGALADAVSSLLADEARRTKLGTRARRRAEGFSWDGMAKRMEAVYLDVCGGR